jgi:hypothetical protein
MNMLAKLYEPVEKDNYYKFDVCCDTLSQAEIIVKRFLAYRFNLRNPKLVYIDDLRYILYDKGTIVGEVELSFSTELVV